MPELPEVETIKRDLNLRIKGKRIIKVEVKDKKPLKSKVSIFQKEVNGRKMADIIRQGKYLLILLVVVLKQWLFIYALVASWFLGTG
jgi:formamidopyrimidine-DNA glycosylase